MLIYIGLLVAVLFALGVGALLGASAATRGAPAVPAIRPRLGSTNLFIRGGSDKHPFCVKVNLAQVTYIEDGGGIYAPGGPTEIVHFANGETVELEDRLSNTEEE